MRFDWISFTTDYGLADGFVAACTGVLGRYAPHARVVDIGHAVPAQDVRQGALLLARTVPYLPPAVHLGVVDPGVGTRRRGIAVVAADGALVGPDNGLLLSAADALGGVRAAYELTETQFWLPRVSRTFHGRDVFAPVAAHLAAGGDPAELGPALDEADLVRLPEPECTVQGSRVRVELVSADAFGNAQFALPADRIPAAWSRTTELLITPAAGDARRVGYAETFAEVAPGEPLVLVDSMGQLSLAVNQSSAMRDFGLAVGAVLEIEPA